MFNMQYGKHLILSSILSATLIAACGGGGSNGNGGNGGGASSSNVGLGLGSQLPPSGRSFYVYATSTTSTTSGSGQDLVSMYQADSNIGDLHLLGTLTPGPNPIAITVVNNRFVYVANNGGVVPPPGVSNPGSISAYTINADGKLTAIAGSPYTAVKNPTSVAANGSYLYATNFEGISVSAFHIESNGALTPIGEFSTNYPSTVDDGIAPASIAFTADGHFAYTANKSHTNATVNGVGNGTVTVFRVESNGALTAIQNTPAGIDPIDVTVIGQSVYVANNQLPGTANTPGNVTTFPINSDGTVGTPVPTVAGLLPQAVVGDSNTVYVATSGAANVAMFARATNGALTHTGDLTVRNTAWNVTLDPSGHFLYVANNAVGSDGGISGFYLSPGASPSPLATYAATPNVTAVAATGVLP